MKSETCPHMQRPGEAEETGRPPCLAGGKFKSSWTYLGGLPWVAPKQIDLCPHPQNLKSLYRGLPWVWSCRPCKWSQQLLLSQSCVLKNGSGCGNIGWNTHSNDGGGASHCQGLTGWSTNWQSHPLDDVLHQLLQHKCPSTLLRVDYIT